MHVKHSHLYHTSCLHQTYSQRCIIVLSPVMYDELVLDEEEGVTLGLPWRRYHLLHLLGGQLGQVVDHLKGVRCVRHAETELELKRLDALAAEVVSLDHE